MRAAHEEFLTLRLPRDLRRDLDAAAQGAPRALSGVVRRALVAGLKVIADNTDVDDEGDVDVDDDPPPAAPGAAMPRAA